MTYLRAAFDHGLILAGQVVRCVSRIVYDNAGHGAKVITPLVILLVLTVQPALAVEVQILPPGSPWPRTQPLSVEMSYLPKMALVEDFYPLQRFKYGVETICREYAATWNAIAHSSNPLSYGNSAWDWNGKWKSEGAGSPWTYPAVPGFEYVGFILPVACSGTLYNPKVFYCAGTCTGTRFHGEQYTCGEAATGNPWCYNVLPPILNDERGIGALYPYCPIGYQEVHNWDDPSLNHCVLKNPDLAKKFPDNICPMRVKSESPYDLEPDPLDPDCNADPYKNFGPPTCPTPTTPNPIIIGTGNKFQQETDYIGTGPFPLSFHRSYNSQQKGGGAVGYGWRYSYGGGISAVSSKASVYRPDGKVLTFSLSSGQLKADADITDTLAQLPNASGWKYTTSDGTVETYDSAGKRTSFTNRAGLTQTYAYSDGTMGANGGYILNASGNPTATVLPAGYAIRVADASGRTLSFGYDAAGHLVKLTDPAGGVYLYKYDESSSVVLSGQALGNNLTSVTYPDGRKRIYGYNEQDKTGNTNLPNALTGITDENSVRYASYWYDAKGRAVKEEHGTSLNQGIDRYQLTYTTDASGNLTNTIVTDPLGTARTYNFAPFLGVVKSTATNQPGGSGCGPASSLTTHDANGNSTSRTDFNGNTTLYTYDLARNLETSRTEATGTAQARTIATEWHPTYRLPVKISEPLRLTTYSYDTTGNLLTKTLQATNDATGAQGLSVTPVGMARTTAWTYNPYGQPLTIDGPRTDVSDISTYTYYDITDPDLSKRGNLATITNALGQTTQISAYDLHGNPLTVIDPNGLVTHLTYDPRSRLISRSAGGETTAYQHDGVGQLTRITQPDGSTLNYTYDAAHRLTAVSDGLGNQIQYTLDAIGNRTREEVRDPTGALTQLRQRVYDALSRLAQDIGAQNQSTAYRYDANGNRTGVTDPLGRDTASAFDPLNRLIRVTDPSGGQTQYDYDGQNRLTRVTDPRNLATTYQQDGLGNTLQQASPDTGTTASAYDPAGNPTTRTDAKGQTTAYQYDALNRVTRIGYQDGAETRYTWDQGQNGLGRLGKIEDTVGGALASAIQYSYDPQGRVNAETRTVNGVDYTIAYRYSGGKLAGLTYPSGRQLTYTRDNGGNIADVRLTDNDQTKVLATNIQYQPFGGIKTYTDGAGQTHSRSYDQDGRIAAYSLVGQNWLLGYDAASRITAQIDGTNAANSAAYGYDSLDRLTGAVLPAANYGYGYDPTGNRTSQTNGATTRNYTTDSASNRLLAIDTGPAKAYAYDANGSITGDGMSQLAYDARGRLTQVTTAAGATQYQINGLGQRIRKSGSDDTVYLYDTAGHLLAETTPTGQTLREYIYLNDIPLVVLQ